MQQTITIKRIFNTSKLVISIRDKNISPITSSDQSSFSYLQAVTHNPRIRSIEIILYKSKLFRKIDIKKRFDKLFKLYIYKEKLIFCIKCF